MAMEDKSQKMKETKLHLLEYHRIANEVRLHRSLNNTAIH